jgi:DNA polymerase/3'-5' exonuclease PolX
VSESARRIDLAGAQKLAAAVVAALSPGCDRIEIAGSIRRESPDVGDIEIVAVPKLVEGARIDMFAPPPLVSVLDAVLDTERKLGRIVAHPTKPAMGERYKKLWLARAGVQLDLFVVSPPAEWGPIFAIRTGPAEYSRAAVIELRRQGLQCESGRILRGNETVPCPDEETFFRLAGLPWMEPWAR